jgi:hypothetical protein
VVRQWLQSHCTRGGKEGGGGRSTHAVTNAFNSFIHTLQSLTQSTRPNPLSILLRTARSIKPTAIPWCRTVLEKLMVAQLVKKLLALYGTQRFTVEFTRAPHPELDESSPTLSHPTSIRWVLLLSHTRLVFFSWDRVRLRPLGTSATNWPTVPAPDDGWWGMWSSRWNEIGRGNRSTRRKPASVPLCSPQIPHNLTWALTRAAAVGSRRLTAWAMAGLIHD